MRPNYAFKPIAEQALRSNETIVPQRLNAALAFMRKRSMFRSLCLLLFCTLLVGCSGDIATADGTGGRLLDYKGGNIVLERKLTRNEAQNATDWLKEHGEDWSRDFVTYAPDVLADLDHADGTSSGLYVFPETVVFVSRGSQLKKEFSESETRKLVSLLGIRRES